MKNDVAYLFQNTLVKIPNPQYIVFYNGEDYYQDITKLRLSNAFLKEDTSGDFEWTATVVNINNADNPIRQRCAVLNEYMIFVDKVRKHSKHMPFEEAVDFAAKECIEEVFVKGIKAEGLMNYIAEHPTVIFSH